MSEAIPSVLFIFSPVCSPQYLGQSVYQSHCTDAAGNGTQGAHNLHILYYKL